MENKKKLIYADDARRAILQEDPKLAYCIDRIKCVDAVEVPCHCCDCYYLLNGKNSFGLYFFCGHQNGLKNLKNTEKDFCPWGKKRCEDV